MDIGKLYRQTHNPVLTLFTSEYNTDLLQHAIINYIKLSTDITISKQSERDVFAIMQYVFNTYANTTCNESVHGEVRRLNKIVIEEAVVIVKSGILMYLRYLKDASTIPVPLARSVLTTDDKSLGYTGNFI